LNGHAAVVGVLLSAGADVNRSNSARYTALHFACMWACVDSVRALLDAGARPDVRNGVGERPMEVVSAVVRSGIVAWSGRMHGVRVHMVCRYARGMARTSHWPQPGQCC